MASSESLNLEVTTSMAGIIALIVFVIAYIFVMTEEFTHLRKSKPVILAAGIIWAIVAIVGHERGLGEAVEVAIRANFLEYTELFLFLLVAMTYVNAMEERLVFESLRAWLVRIGLNYRQLFWVTGILAFFISPIADNLTTALIMCAVVMAMGVNNPRFISIACINIVVAANAGGAFSPFGDITTLMVWQKGVIPFQDFFKLFVPSAVSFLVPAMIMQFAVPKAKPKGLSTEIIHMKPGARSIMLLFILTIATAVSFHSFLGLPPVIGMMTGLGYLNIFGYFLKQQALIKNKSGNKGYHLFDIFNKIKRVEWDTLFFFYGIILSVGGLATLGYLELASNTMYYQWGANLSEAFQATPANTVAGMLSAVIGNIPVMFAILTMNPIMPEGQWLLVTLTAGIGGSLLSIGSAAGAALMGQSKGQYTFFSHLKWSWAILLGYLLSIAVHIWINADSFQRATG
ncbi:MAG: sodium:proton antiporter NhaD [Gammaproteobacteria bacterium]